MHTEKYQPIPTFMGVTPESLGMMPKMRLHLTKREEQTLRKAQEIREEARDRLRATMGKDDNGLDIYETSGLYVLNIDDLIGGPLVYDEYT